MLFLLSVGFISFLSFPDPVIAQSVCSVNQIAADDCEFKYDGECDASTSFCSAETDCYDCDPCRAFRSDCAACTAQPLCGYCTLGTGVGVCLSLGYTEYIPELCSEDEGGTDWVLTTDQCDASSVGVGTPSGGTDDTCQVGVCRYEFDGECDAGTYCLADTDCFDCDPCRAYASSCSRCVEEGCRYGFQEISAFLGFLTSTEPICSSPTNAATAVARTSLRVEYVSTCADGGGGGTPTGGAPTNQSPQASPSLPAAPTPAVEYNCDYNSDSCIYTFDGVCDAGTVFCRSSRSDCFDCDPCMEHRFGGCSGCTAAGCTWCAADALCISASTNSRTTFPSSVSSSCRVPSDYVGSCEDEETGGQDDPLYNSQSWLFDIVNVKEAWDMGYSKWKPQPFLGLSSHIYPVAGDGIGIRVNDDGVDHTHPEIRGKFDVSQSCSIFRPADLRNRKHGHGTAVASLAAGAASNGVCGTGIAFDARISGCRIINSENPEQVAPEILDSSVLYDNMEDMQISQNSYGIPTCQVTSSQQRNLQSSTCPFKNDQVCNACNRVDWSNPSPNFNCERSITSYCRSAVKSEQSPEACIDFLDLFTDCQYNSVSAAERNAFRRGATRGRNGKGIIYVFASGNEHHAGADVNFEGVLASRYTISVGAVGRDGLHASYSTGGAALLVTAPGGDSDHYTNNLVANPGGGCYSMGPGTSFSAPIVSGVIALVLQANGELSWRDVQAILATSSRKADENHESWATNGAGLHHSYLYGFGIVDAGAAVKAALTWDLYPPERQIVVGSGDLDLPVPDYPNDAVSSDIEIDDESFIVESVTVHLDLFHSSRGDLEVTLISPEGTESILHPSRRPENTMEERWKLLTVRHWGETAQGSWTLRLVDHREGAVESCVDRLWSVRTTTVELTCSLMERVRACEDGGEGSRFGSLFAGGSTLFDADLTDGENGAPGNACCACGGGTSPDDVDNVLRSWSLTLHGHIQSEPVPPDSPRQAPIATTPIAVAPTPQSVDALPPTQSVAVEPELGPVPGSPTTDRPPILGPILKSASFSSALFQTIGSTLTALIFLM